MLGIDSIGVLAAYLLCIASAILCVIYGLINWNRGDEPIEPEDVQWASEDLGNDTVWNDMGSLITGDGSTMTVFDPMVPSGYIYQVISY